MLRLKGTAQHYAWGRPASDSMVSFLLGAEEQDSSKPYAELWMGTHPSGPTFLFGTDTTLQSFVASNPACLGDVLSSKFGHDLPFLFKVLSVQTALSIQSHPDKALAERLHAERPEVYKDDNHKPEMAIALQPFEALCSFVTNEELLKVLDTVPELSKCIEASIIQAFRANPSPDTLKAMFKALMTCSSSAAESAVCALVERLAARDVTSLTDPESLAVRLHKQYPNDVGVLCAFFLNYLRLEAGQGIYLPANEPHAYLSGDIVEIMATSDNVIRAGLTGKLRDTDVLCDSLTYTQGAPEILRGAPTEEGSTTLVYRPPFEEFELKFLKCGPGVRETWVAAQGPEIVLVRAGSGRIEAMGGPMDGHADLMTECRASTGHVLFVPAGTQVVVQPDGEAPLELWRASANSKVFADVPETAAQPEADQAAELVAA